MTQFRLSASLGLAFTAWIHSQLGACASPVSSYTALGDNWWMAYMDGWAHPWGEYAFEGSNVSRMNGVDGLFTAHLHTVHDSLVGKIGRQWNAPLLANVNQQLQGLSPCSWGGDKKCLHAYTNWVPRPNTDSLKSQPHVGPDFGVSRGGWFANHSDKADALESALSHYYTADAVVQQASMQPFGLWTADQTPSKPRQQLGAALPLLAEFFSTMAELHPFNDSNSRTRVVFLQTELCRLGAHPVMLPSMGWYIYSIPTMDQLELFLLGSYCAWEYALYHGVSPYADLLSADDHGHAQARTQGSLLPGRLAASAEAASPPEQGSDEYHRVEAMAVARSAQLYDNTRDECVRR